MPVPTVLAWMVGVAGVAVLAKTVSREWKKVNAALHPQRAKRQSPFGDPFGNDSPFARESLPTLRRDPRTGIYRADPRG